MDICGENSFLRLFAQQPIRHRFVSAAFVESDYFLAFLALPIDSKLKPLKQISFLKR